jgi:mono/diheme cytochrome c family protein
MMKIPTDRLRKSLAGLSTCIALTLTLLPIYGVQADSLPLSRKPTTVNVLPPEPVNRFTATDGGQLFASICQGCHMPDAKGAKGAGMFPALANNPKLTSAAYPQFVVLNGLRGMPSFAHDLNDVQIAAVVNYVITHFGNHAKPLTTPESVKAVRPAR